MIRRLTTLIFALCAVGGCWSPDGVSSESAAFAAKTALAAGAAVSSNAADPAQLSNAAEKTSARTPAPWPDNVPGVDTLAETPHGAEIRRGHAILTATKDSLPQYVGNDLRCTSCHLDDGRRANALPWVGLMARFPQYRARNARINTIEDRVNDCLERSLVGRALPTDDPAMRAIVSYFAFLSHGVPVGSRLVGQGTPPVRLETANRARGDSVYSATCARCHGGAGDGTSLAPPVWGNGAYSLGAGMGRVRTMAAFVAANMPHDNPGMDPQDAMDVAAYVNAQTRPAFARAALDWPFGGAPMDVPYATAGRTPVRWE